MVDRELAFLDRDAQKKLEAFEKARTVSKPFAPTLWETTGAPGWDQIQAETQFLPVVT